MRLLETLLAPTWYKISPIIYQRYSISINDYILFSIILLGLAPYSFLLAIASAVVVLLPPDAESHKIPCIRTIFLVVWLRWLRFWVLVGLYV